jgi:hypothetical protein
LQLASSRRVLQVSYMLEVQQHAVWAVALRGAHELQGLLVPTSSQCFLRDQHMHAMRRRLLMSS